MARKKAPRRKAAASAPNAADSAPSPKEAREILGNRPKKRKKAGNPGKKATNKEIHDRIVSVAQMVARRLQKNQIKAFMLAKFGLGARSAEIYIARAREYLIEQADRPKEQFISEAIGLYEEVIRNPESSLRDRMEAQGHLRQLLGLDAPGKIAHTTPDGSESAPLIVAAAVGTLPDNQLRALHALNWAIEQARNPAPAKITQQNDACETPILGSAKKVLTPEPLTTSDAKLAPSDFVIDAEFRESLPDATE